jgi:hypothetical protein
MSNLEEHLEERPVAAYPEKVWVDCRDLVYNAANHTLGHPKRKHQDCFDDDDDQITSIL